MTDETAFRVGFVHGVTLTKWSRVWEERHPELPLEIFHIDAKDPAARLRDGTADVVFARLPIDRDGFSVIPLYEEQPVVVLPKGHALADLEAVALVDLEGQTRFDLDASLDLADVVEVVESGAGVAVLPQSLARLYARKGVVARPVVDLPTTTIALVWPEDLTTDEVSDFIGVVRGRTANSSRDRREVEAAPETKSKAKPRAEQSKPTQRARGRGPQRGRGRGGPSRGSRRS